MRTGQKKRGAAGAAPQGSIRLGGNTDVRGGNATLLRGPNRGRSDPLADRDSNRHASAVGTDSPNKINAASAADKLTVSSPNVPAVPIRDDVTGWRVPPPRPAWRAC